MKKKMEKLKKNINEAFISDPNVSVSKSTSILERLKGRFINLDKVLMHLELLNSMGYLGVHELIRRDLNPSRKSPFTKEVTTLLNERKIKEVKECTNCKGNFCQKGTIYLIQTS